MPDWPVLSRYDAAHLREIAIPVGGIGTGFFALGGRGQLVDWQLMSRPNRGWRLMCSHLVVRAKSGGMGERKSGGGGQAVKVRVVEGDLVDGLAGDSGAPAVLAGIPRFRDAAFEATYPFGRALLSDPDTPVSVAVEAFNPLIPGETDLSSLPIALLTATLENRTAAPLEASLTLLLSNFIGTDGIARDLKDNVTERAEAGGWRGMRFAKTRPARTAQNGTLVVLCDAPDVRVARRWTFRDRPWGGETLGIIDALMAHGFIEDDEPAKPCPPSPNDTWDGSLSAMLTLGPREARSVRLLFAWHFPHRNMQEEGWWSGKPGEDPVLGNYYATKFADALDVAKQVIPRLPELRERTISFVKRVVDYPAPHAMKEAALFNLTALRTHTSFRLADGTFAGFEGCNATTCCCHGSCTHVWNYEEATVRLFPDLHRSMLESHLRHDMTAAGAQRFRLSMPMAEPTWHGAAADGQMGVIVRVYEQFLAEKGGMGEWGSGGKDEEAERRAVEWLKGVYPVVKSMLEYAWVPGGWDADRDGVMEGAQHNTYDVEFFGPNPMCTVWYLAALAAMEKMAPLAGDPEFAAVCADLRARGSRWVDGNLFNGSYYVHRVELPKVPPDPFTVLGQEHASASPRFQVGGGCLIDQLVGQYKANRVGLGDLLDRMHAHAAALSVFRNNYRANFRDHYNNMRTFATADESGTLICSYPEGERPAQPFPYWSECMTGFEYQLAALLLDFGEREAATKVVEAVRGRHNGANRNPFNEPECGSYYARAMASWALLEAWSGMKG